MEEISFSEWAESMDISGSNHWLPAYGYQQPIQDGDANDGAAMLNGTQQSPFIFLETILEETSDDLQSESDRSGHAGWPDSDSDTESVIHVPHGNGLCGEDDARAWSGSERDLAVPKKRRRRTDDGEDDDEDEHEDEHGDAASLSSRSSSLLQFENLEKHCENIFHTSATSDPFEGSSPRQLDSTFSFDSLESNRWRFSGSPDSLDDLPGEDSTSSDDDDDASSDDTMLHSSWSSKGSFRSQNSRIRSYRSFDSLNILQQQQQHVSLVELSQSLNNDDFVLTQYDAFDSFDKSLVVATADLSKLGGEDDKVMTSELALRSNEDVSVKVEPVIKETKPQRSAENLSEDSGFGDHIPKLSSLHGRLRNATIIEDEDSCSSYYSSGSSSGDSEEGENIVLASSKSLKLPTDTEYVERRGGGGGWGDEESKFSNSCWQSAPNLATLLYSCREEGEDDELGGFAARLDEAAKSVSIGQPIRSVTSHTPAANVSLPDIIDIVVDHDDVVVHDKVVFEDSITIFNPFTMANRLPVMSTPNLNYGGDFLQNEQKQQSQLSLNRVPLKHFSVDEDELDKEATSKSLTPLPSSGAKGVHFCPVVSEVSWRESYSEEELEDDTYDHEFVGDAAEEAPEDHDDDDDEDDEDTENEEDEDTEADTDEEADRIEEKSILAEEQVEVVRIVEIVPREVGHQLERPVVSEPATAEGSVVVVGAVTDSARLNTMAQPVPPTPVSGHVAREPRSGKPNEAAVGSVNPSAMDACVKSSESMEATAATKKPATSRFGGFFQRFSFRKRHDVKKEEKKKAEPSSKKPKIAKKPEQYNEYEDVTIIPLHPGPGEAVDAVNVMVSSKPPLPPMPPRVVGASSKAPAPASRRALAVLQPSQGQHRRPTPLGDSSSSMSALVNGKASSIDPKYGQHPTGLLETDLDTDITVSAQRPPLPNVAPKKARSLLNLGMNHGLTIHNGAHQPTGMLKPPTGAGANSGHRPHGHGGSVDARAKSMEFLLDKENQAAVLPPENELQKGGGGGDRVMSEHQLRVQRSLQKLNVPDWYKNSTVARGHEGFLLRKDAAQQARETTHQGWPGLGSKTTSLSSLGSTQSAAARSPTSHLLSPSPTPSSHVFTRWSTSRLNSGGTSASTSPCNSTRSSFNYRQPYLGWRSQERLSRPRTPAERLAAGILPPQVPVQQQQQVPNLSEVRTSIKEVTSAIVHYVSGVRDGSGEIAHPDESPANRSPRWERDTLWGNVSRSSSPRGSGRLCWLESSFVGSRPLEVPETPQTLSNDVNKTINNDIAAMSGPDLYLDLNNSKQQQRFNAAHRVNGTDDDVDCYEPDVEFDLLHNVDTELRRITQVTEVRNKPSPGSTTLEDVLDSLLGLPPTSRSPSPGGASVSSPSRPQLQPPGRPHARRSCGDIRTDLAESASDGARSNSATAERPPYYVGDTHRRRSEGSEAVLRHPGKAVAVHARAARRVSFDIVGALEPEPLVRCRYSKCSNTASVVEARRNFKTCHNCAHVYCSRECRRAHWERHRKTCLHSRVGALCRQVLAAAKEDPATLKHISLLARRGYLAQGRGAVKSFFSSPELAEQFVSRGFLDLGEPAYVRWSDLLPNEMGPELYSELVRLCKSYNPDTRLVLYVAVCVVSEVPTSGAVKWERQLVSRCAKMRLCRSLTAVLPQPPAVPPRRTSPNITRDMENPETLILTSLPGVQGTVDPQRAREISFTNIQRHLRQKGVSLRRHFPDVYKKLCGYVEGSVEKFTPVTIYPRDTVSGKNFMCIIMPDAEPEKLEMVPQDSSRVQTIDISIEHEGT